jgi:hypothetical protein
MGECNSYHSTAEFYITRMFEEKKVESINQIVFTVFATKIRDSALKLRSQTGKS